MSIFDRISLGEICDVSGIAVEATYREFLQKVVSGQLSLKDSDLDWSSYLHQVMES
ncbi:hypothetical protein [Agarivorans sp. OAG1]|uniref:hypothetical protein n=1 Tax=Agarivorans sp. OAG1 TaxID=3082387 RepID=UPI0030CEEF2E